MIKNWLETTKDSEKQKRINDAHFETHVGKPDFNISKRSKNNKIEKQNLREIYDHCTYN